MNSKTYIILAFLSLGGCKYDSTRKEVPASKNIEYELIKYDEDSLILYQKFIPNIKINQSETEFRGIDYYSCYYDNENELNIEMSFGIMNGETFYINSNKMSFSTEIKSWGCTSHESFSYRTLHQKFVLNSSNVINQDSIIGYVEYEGIQDIESKRKELENHKLDKSWLENLKPSIIKIRGNFKLKIYKHQSDQSNEYDRAKLVRRSIFEKELEKAEEYKIDSLSLKGLHLDTFPPEIKSLTQLKILNCEANNFENFDFSELAQLKNLETIYLGWNGFKEFPMNIDQFEKLETIDLRGNPIKRLSTNFKVNSNWKLINLKGNKLEENDIITLSKQVNLIY